MTTVIFVRHGESMANKDNKFAGSRTDAALQERGLRQAELMAEYVAENYEIGNVYTSDLQRAYITGKCVADKFGLEVTVREELREIDGGNWEGVTFDDMGRLYPEEFRLWVTDYGHSGCPGGESVSQLAERIMAAAIRIAEENPGKTVLIATHASPVRVMQGLVQNGNLENMNRIPWASNASLTVMEYDRGSWRCTASSLDTYLGELKTELPKTV